MIITTFVELMPCHSDRIQPSLGMIQIVDFQPSHASAFKRIGEEWMNEFMAIEVQDAALLNDPQQNIIDQNGFIFMAIDRGNLVGTCALVKRSKDKWELSKLGVTSSHRGLGIGKRLSQRVIEQAKTLDLEFLYLESSHKLESALGLYEHLGFKPDNSCAQQASQCDVRLVLNLKA